MSTLDSKDGTADIYQFRWILLSISFRTKEGGKAHLRRFLERSVQLSLRRIEKKSAVKMEEQ
jgi:N-dimethylarginine dimethylaminohydrolase